MYYIYSLVVGSLCLIFTEPYVLTVQPHKFPKNNFSYTAGKYFTT